MDEPVPSEYYQLELPYKPSSASVYWKKITIPKGLPSLLETFVREAIRENPDDTYKFLAELSETLLAKRAAEEQEAESAAANFKKEKQAADEESPLLDSKLPIPTSYKIEDQKEKEPASKEEQVESVLSSSVSPTTSSPPPAAVVEQDAESALAEEIAAATKIQSQFRGFKTRKELKEQVQQKPQEQPESPTTPTSPTSEAEPEAIVPEAEQTEKENENDYEISATSPQPEEIAAATKIQSQFRGFKTRKELREQLNQNEDLKSNSPTIPEEEVILEAVTVAPVASAPPPPEEQVSTSPTGNPLEKEVDDEEIAAAITTPLETIREESFDHSSSAPQQQPAIPSPAAVDEVDGDDADAKSGAENEAGKDQDSVLVEENEESTSPDGDVIIINEIEEQQEEEDADKGVLEKEESIEVDIERSSSKPNSATSQGRSYQVEAVSNEDISAALAALADSSESGDDPSLSEAAVGTKGPTSSSNDIDNKNDEMAHESSSPTGSVGEISSSSQDKNDDAKDEIPVADENSASSQNGDQPSETAGLEGEVQPTEPISSPQPQPITDNEDGIPPHENPESTTDAPVVGDVEDKAEETPNVLPPQEGDDDVDNVPQQDSNEEEALGVINLSSDDGALVISDTANVSEADQTPICAEGESDKNKKSDVADDGDDDLVAAPDDDVGMQNIENAEVETNAEKNTENITDTAPQFTTDGEQPEVGQPVEEVGVGDDAEKTESNQLQQSPSALTTESSVDREDTDIATPTDFSAAEEKEELNLDELKKFASNFDEEFQEFGDQQDNGMEAVSTVEEAGVVEPEITKTVAPVRNQTPSQKSTTSGETASSGDAGVLQVEIKSSEPASPAPAAEGDASKPASPEATATAEVAETVVSPTPSTEQKSVETATPNEPATTPEIASPTPVEEAKPAGEEKAAETPITSPAPESVASPTPEVASPQPEAVASPTADEAKSPEPPVPILRPGSGESQSAEQVASPTPAEEKPAETVASPPPSGETSPSAEQATSPAPAESPKSPEPASPEAAKSPEPASPESAKSPEPASPEAAKSPEPASPESAKSPEPASPESAKSPEPASPEAAKSPEPASPEAAKSPEPSPAESVKSPEPQEQATSPAPTDSPREPQSPPAAASPSASEPELQKTEAASPITSPPPSAAATPAPEQITPSPPPVSESPTTTQETAIPANSSPTSPEPSSTPTTTNQPEKSDTETTNQTPTSAAAGGEQPEQASPAPAESKQGEKAIGTTVVEEKRKESIEPVKQEKPPVVKRRLGWDKQAPRPPATIPLDAPVKKEEDAAVVKEEDSSPLIAQVEIASSISPSPTASPVLRRSKPGSGRNRSRAATNKYRSGLVIEQGISMDEMEKEIENEMMNSAATKIQAGFRGFKTRKSITGVSKKGKGTPTPAAKLADPQDQSAIPEKCLSTAAAEAENNEAAATPVASARLSPEYAKDAESIALNAAIIAAAASRGGKPPLSCLRSRSYPGSHEDEHPILEFDESDEDLLFHPEPEIDLELDPDYINRAATKIQANFRGYRVRKSFKRPAGKEHNGDKSLLKSQKLAEADKAAEERAKVMETHERLQQRDEDELSYEDFDAPAEPEKAAAKIQASFRSYKERQRFHRKKKAAITIQASIRGFLTRKRLANMRRRSFQRRRSSAKAFHKELEEIKKLQGALEDAEEQYDK